MKKLILTLALVAGATVAQAADTYMYWMLDQTPNSSTRSGATYSEYYARVKMVDDKGNSSYLTFADGGVATEYTDLYAEASSDPYQMYLTGTVYQNKSFIIELWNDDALTAKTEASFRKTIAWADVQTYITTGSTGHINPAMVSLSSFSAVPEPTSGMMMLLGAMLLGLKRKKLA